MADKLIDLTPRGILNYMKKIEGAIQRDELVLYSPVCLDKQTVLSNELLEEETRSMLEFVGLTGYAVDVKFQKTEDGVAGNITSANNTYERAVHINVSEKYTKLWKCCIAILAHEICHKVLAVNGLYEQDVDTNETLVDLSTIYVGFGHLILNGYVSDSRQQIIGYLNLNNYKVAHHIISVVYGRESTDSTGLKDVDVLIDDALGIWEKAESEYSLMKDCFSENEKQLSEFHRNLSLLEQIIVCCKQNMIHEYASFDNIFFKTLQEKDGKYRNKLTALGILYELLAKDSYPKHKEIPYIARMNTIVNNAIYDLFQLYQTRNPLEFKYDIECPHCGNKMQNNNRIVDRNAILRCSKCGCHYYYWGEHWNFSKRQRELKEAKIQENEKIEQKVAQRLEEIMKSADLRVLEEKEKARKSIENAQEKAKLEIRQIEIFEQENYKEKVRKKIPPYLRWLVNKYL